MPLFTHNRHELTNAAACGVVRSFVECTFERQACLPRVSMITDPCEACVYV